MNIPDWTCGGVRDQLGDLLPEFHGGKKDWPGNLSRNIWSLVYVYGVPGPN